ncbi:hypothetical protein, partial [Providencia stuartii]|uniref:hypothetical protein n=1 Tax=Providencia stuartii TaxID=588 RepID=UPI001954E5DA
TKNKIKKTMAEKIAKTKKRKEKKKKKSKIYKIKRRLFVRFYKFFMNKRSAIEKLSNYEYPKLNWIKYERDGYIVYNV